MDNDTKKAGEDFHENPLHKKFVSLTTTKAPLDTEKEAREHHVKLDVHKVEKNDPGDEDRSHRATLRFRTIAKVVEAETTSLKESRNRLQSRKHRRHSTYNAADVSIHAIEGQPHVEQDWGTFFWAFLVHFFYPFGSLYVYLVDGKQCFINMRFGFGGFMQISFTHILFICPVVALIWILIEPSAMEQYGWEIIVLWFSHVSRLIGIAVKYSHVNKLKLEEFKTTTQEIAEKIQMNMMLPSGWFQPNYEQWFPIVKNAEHLANEVIGLHSLTMGHGLNSHLTYIGHSAVEKIEQFIKPYVDKDEIKQMDWTVHKSLKGTMNDNKVPVLEVSAGIILIAMLDGDDMKKAHLTLPRTLLDGVLLGLFASTLGIWFRIGKGMPGGGDHYASGFFIFTIVYCSFWNFWSFFIFLECAVVDYQRRYLLQKKLASQLKCSLTTDGLFHIMPKLLDLRRGTNGATYIALRQVIKYLGKDFRLRLQWIISYSLFLCVMFMLSFFTLVGKVDKSFGLPQWYATFFIVVYGLVFIVRALYWADKSNSIPAEEELRDFEIQIMQAHVELNTHLMFNEKDEIKLHELEIEKNSVSFLRECIRFIQRDDEQSPIQIIGVRADWKLFQGFIATILAFLITFAEFVGLEAIGIDGVGGD
jgi:hypothetical protein